MALGIKAFTGWGLQGLGFGALLCFSLLPSFGLRKLGVNPKNLDPDASTPAAFLE